MQASTMKVSQSGDVLQFLDNPVAGPLRMSKIVFFGSLLAMLLSFGANVVYSQGEHPPRFLLSLISFALPAAIVAAVVWGTLQQYIAGFRLTPGAIMGPLGVATREEVAGFTIRSELQSGARRFRRVVIGAKLTDDTVRPVLWFSRDVSATEAVRRIAAHWGRPELAEAAVIETELKAPSNPSDGVIRSSPGVYEFQDRFGAWFSPWLILAGILASRIAFSVYRALFGELTLESAIITLVWALGVFLSAPMRRTLVARFDGVGLKSKFFPLYPTPWKEIARIDASSHPTQSVVCLVRTDGKLIELSPFLSAGDAAWLVKELRERKRVADSQVT